MSAKRKIRIVNYAINGSGVGHLTRLVAINRWVRRYAEFLGVRAEVYFLSSSEADGLLLRERFASFKLPSKTIVREAGIDKLAYLALAKQWVWHSLGLLRPDLLVVDTFPRGSFGELLSALDLAKHRAFVYRPLKRAFAARADFQAMLPLYDAILVPDHRDDADVLAPAAARPRLRHTGPVIVRERVEAFDRAEARRVLGIADERLAVYVSAGGGGDPGSQDQLRLVREALGDDDGIHLVCGGGPLYRGRRERGPRLTWLQGECAAELMPGFDLAISAAGYNSFFELMHMGVPAVFLPQEKVADEQDRRALRAVQAGAAFVAEPTRAGIRAAVARLRSAEARELAGAAARGLVPRNNARVAAAELLRLVLPDREVDAAEEALGDDLLTAARDLGLGLEPFVQLGAALDPRPRGETDPEEVARSCELAGELLRFLDARGLPLAPAMRVVEPLARKLARATPDERARAARTVLEAFLPFEDWPGAAMVIRTLRNEKELSGEELARGLSGFLSALREREQDLYAGLAQLSSAQGAGVELPTNRELLRAAGALV